jgi:predicted porin
LFGRYAWVGLADDTYGTIKMGRQYGGAFNFYAFNFDPIGGGNLPATDWELYLTGIRFDNTLQYSKDLGPVTVELQHSFGGQPGSASVGSTSTAALYDRIGSGKIGIFGQESKDGTGHKLVVGSAGATYSFGPTTLYSYYIYARRDAGFQVGTSGTSDPLANTNIMNNANTAYGPQTDPRTDQFIRIGANYSLSPFWKFTLAAAYDHAQNVAPGQNGQLMTVYGMADYLFTKRTDVYLEVDENRAYGASVDDPNSPFGTEPGVRQVLGASLSLRTLF